MQRLFVYGSLMPTGQNNNILKKFNGNWQKAFIYGDLKIIKIKNMEYFAVNLKSQIKKRIFGYLFSSYLLNYLWSTLDEFEGINYRRVKTKVFTNNYKNIDAYVYELNLNE